MEKAMFFLVKRCVVVPRSSPWGAPAGLRSAKTLSRQLGITYKELTDVLRTAYSVEGHRHHLGELAAAGVDSFVLQLPCASVEGALEGLEKYAAEFF